MEFRLKTTFWDVLERDKIRNANWLFGILFMANLVFSDTMVNAILAGMGLVISLMIELSYLKWAKHGWKDGQNT
jgi:hypothetical protein